MSAKSEEAIAGTDMAYAAVMEGPENGRERMGWYLGLARRDESGYHQLKPGYGPYESQEAANEHADALNLQLGHPDKASAMLVILSSMREDGRRRSR